MRMARVGVYVDRTKANDFWLNERNVFQLYIEELLRYFGVGFQPLSDIHGESLRGIDVLICGFESDDGRTAAAILRFAEQGGIVISCGGLSSLAEILGCTAADGSSAGYANLRDCCPGHEQVRYLHGKPWRLAGNPQTGANSYEAAEHGTLHEGSPDGPILGPALLSWRVGQGRIERWAIDIPSTIVELQQGSKPIHEDGMPAPDGSANVQDGILKADDVMEQDWTLDRQVTATGAPYFAYPYADYWRETWFAHLIATAAAEGLSVPFLDFWPDGVQAVATVSHDSDFNQDEHALAALALLRELQIRSTWCMLVPGYSEAIYAHALADGHELAFHFNALHLENHEWSENEFVDQLQFIRRRTSSAIVSNKNHYTRMEGWGDFFRWCETHGIACDQSRGSSKRGNVGFLFGTCHPYFPIAWADERNRVYDVVEIGFLTQDLNVNEHTSDTSIIKPLLQAVGQARGVAHFLFHQNHIHAKESVRSAFREFVKEAEAMGFPFWTSQQINDWVRAKRGVRIKEVNAGEVVVEGPDVPAGLVVWIPVSGERAGPENREIAQRFGVPCKKVVLSLHGGEKVKCCEKV